ncbi:MAG: PaaI family thioesterase [Lewinella sp.]|nr:PaaI family thioesterase [Lewinella sp.]
MNALIQNKIRESFSRQGLMHTLGASIRSIEPGRVVIECPFQPGLSQQNGFFHAGAVSGLVDSACGYASLSVMEEDADVLSAEFKINLLKPADTQLLVAEGKVIQAGRTLVICEGWAWDETGTKLLAKMQATMVAIRPGK